MKKFSLRKFFQNTFEDHEGRPGKVGGSLPRRSGTRLTGTEVGGRTREAKWDPQRKPSGKMSIERRREIRELLDQAKSFSPGFFGKPVDYDEFLEGGPGLHGGTISSARETEVLSVDGGRVRVKTSHNFGSFAVSKVEGSYPSVGDTVKLIQEHKKGPRGNTTSAFNYIVTQNFGK